MDDTVGSMAVWSREGVGQSCVPGGEQGPGLGGSPDSLPPEMRADARWGRRGGRSMRTVSLVGASVFSVN